MKGNMTDYTDTFRLYGTCGVCKKEGFFRKKYTHTLPNGIPIYSKSFMCKKCRKDVESKVSGI